MPVLTDIADVLTRKMPDVVSPRVRPLLDTSLGASLLLAGAWFWKRNRSAARAALLCGGAEMCATLLTDYSGDGRKPLSMRTRKKIDLGLTAILTSVPRSAENEDHTTFFLANAVFLIALSNLTREKKTLAEYRKKRPHKVA
jgi:hypothetical protein